MSIHWYMLRTKSAADGDYLDGEWRSVTSGTSTWHKFTHTDVETGEVLAKASVRLGPDAFYSNELGKVLRIASDRALGDGMWVAPRFRGQGLGTALHRTVARHLAKQGYPYKMSMIHSGNKAAIRAATKAGAVKFATESVPKKRRLRAWLKRVRRFLP